MSKVYITKMLPLLSLEESLNAPEVESLVKNGWFIVQMLPVVDEGKACVILILRKKEPKTVKDTLNWLEVIQCIVLIFIAIVICLLYSS